MRQLTQNYYWLIFIETNVASINVWFIKYIDTGCHGKLSNPSWMQHAIHISPNKFIRRFPTQFNFKHFRLTNGYFIIWEVKFSIYWVYFYLYLWNVNKGKLSNWETIKEWNASSTHINGKSYFLSYWIVAK